MKKIKDTNAEYHSSDAISASGLKFIASESVKNFLIREPFSSKAMELGSAVHGAILEPESFDSEFYVMPKVDARTKAGKEEKAKHMELSKGKTIIDVEQKDIIDVMMDNYVKNEDAVNYCTGDIEVSHYFQHEGIDVRVRPDIINYEKGFIADIKTCQDNSPTKFRKDVLNFNYALQATFYSDMLGFDPKAFRFIAIRTKYPYNVEVYGLSDYLIECGREGFKHQGNFIKGWKQAFQDWKFYKETGIALGYNTHERNEDGTMIL